jgi:cytochrome b
MSSTLREPTISDATFGPSKIIVWDPFVRLFHWLLVACVLVAFATSLILPITWLGWHLVTGLAALALVTARIVWGFLGSTYARFSTFLRAPRTLLAHLRELRQGRAHRHRGHNPLGGVMILALIALVIGIGVTGAFAIGGAFKMGPFAYATSFVAGRTAWSIHQLLAYALMALILLHIGGAIYESRRTKENLVRAMLDGRKEARREDVAAPPRQSYPGLAAGIVAIGLLGTAAVVTVMTGRPVPGVPNQPLDKIYAQECGACHVAYHPSLLAAATWSAIMDGLAHHFGENAELEAATAQSVRAYLVANAAEHYDTLAAHAFLKQNPAEPLRITATPFWTRRHASIPPQVFSSKVVGNGGQCDACHQDASAGRYSPFSIAIPHGSFQ